MATGETDITSTTSEEPAENHTSALEASPKKDQNVQNEADFKDVVSSTPLKKRSSKLELIASTSDEQLVEKRKRGRPRKKIRSSIANNANPDPENSTRLSLPAKSTADAIVAVQNEVKLTSTVPSRHLRASKSSSDGTGCRYISEFERFIKRQIQFEKDSEKDLPIRKRSRLRCETSL